MAGNDRDAGSGADAAAVVEELTENECWALLRTVVVGRLAVRVQDHPDIFPVNVAVDHGTLVFRTGPGTKLAAASAEWPVAFESDGYDSATGLAWSVVVKGRAEPITARQDLLGTLDLPVLPWQAGDKGRFVRIVPTTTSGRRFPVADPAMWRTPITGARRAPAE